MTNILQLKPIYRESLEDTVEKYRSIDREIKRLEKSKDLLKKTIVDALNGFNEVFNKQGAVIATYQESNRSLFDKKSFDSDHPGLYEKYTTIGTFYSLRLK